MDYDFKEDLTKMFFGVIPEPLNNLPEDLLDKVIASISVQDARSVRRINYVELLHDLFDALLTPKIIKSLKGKPLTQEDMLRYLKTSRILLATSYLKIMQGGGLPSFKADTAYFYRNFIQTFTNIYGVDCIEQQDSFIEMTIKDEKTYIDLNNQFEELMIAIDHKTIEIEISPYWSDPSELIALSDELFQAKFITDSQAFCQVFSKRLEKTCDWQKNKTSLIYLFGLLFLDKNLFPNPIFAVIAERFVFRGKPTNIKTLSTQHIQMEHNFGNDEETLKGEFLQIYKIYKSVFKA